MESLSLQKQRALLRMEYEHEKEEFRRETEAMGIDRKVKRGECWYPVSVGRYYYNSLNRLVIEIFRIDDTEIEHNFEYGRSLTFFEQDASGMLHYVNFSGSVSYVDGDRMVVCLPHEDAAAVLQNAERLGVQRNFDERTYQLMFDAIDRTMAAEKGRVAHLRDIFHGGVKPEFAPPRMPVSLPWLNPSQERAVNDVLRTRDVLIVHGPPGTGKTTTLVEAISEVLRREPQVMVCAQSNTAVDWIAEQLYDRGISVLRIGNPTRVTDKMLAQTYERRFADHPDYPQLWQIRRNVRQLLSSPRKERAANFHQKISRLRERADELEIRIRHALFDTSRVIACTLAGAANPVLSGQHYHTLFVDEAAQALEAACWIALQKADRVVFAGDHQQLPPTVKCPEAMRSGLGVTLMEHAAKKLPECVRLLTVQYRMNEELMRFSSDWFYDGKLTAAPEVHHRSILSDLDAPLQWVDTAVLDSGEEFVGNGYGRINKEEAQLTVRVLCQYADRVGMRRLLDECVDIGVISPYRAQVQYLRKIIRQCATLKPLRRQITVNTVDAFQGQERDIIIVSLVRANEQGNIGFLRDLRRMNVAMTRARMKLIILGNSETLCRHRFYRELFRRCDKYNRKGEE